MTSIDLPKRNDTLISIFNPLQFDFMVKLRNEKNVYVEYIVPSMEIETFPTYIADIIKNKLVRAIQDDRDIGYYDKEKEDEIRKEISVEN